MFDRKKFGQRLRQIRTEKNIKAKDLAEALNLSKAAISQFENGSSVPSSETLLAMSQYLDVPVEKMMSNSQPDYVVNTGDQTFLVELKCNNTETEKQILDNIMLAFQRRAKFTKASDGVVFDNDKIRITERTISDYESEKKVPGLDVVIALAEFFNVSIDYLVGRTDKPEINK